MAEEEIQEIQESSEAGEGTVEAVVTAQPEGTDSPGTGDSSQNLSSMKECLPASIDRSGVEQRF